ncbi:MAG: DUF488 domain-containing protein [Peptostreptococcaceae bacterium]|nr:DUF488 domain-containing protein [Peptostreptococcaceae bacterium]
MEYTVYTIGHSTISNEEFIKLLKHYKINCIVDVRSVPYSQYANQFNRELIKNELKKNRIMYIYMGEEFGARRKDKNLYTNSVLDFEKTAKDKSFIKGVERVKEGLEKGFNIAIMCSEKEPINCHRCILVGHQLSQIGWKVNNILSDSLTIEQSKIDILLLDKYYPNRNQLSIFGNPSDKELIAKAYKKQNHEIGYRKENEN